MAASIATHMEQRQAAPAIALAKPGRVLSVDVLRGLTIAMMILVNDPGDWGHVFGPLDHAAWNGWTVTDLVFPTFLFLMGASMWFSFAARVAKGDCRKGLTAHVWARFAKLFFLALAITYFPRMHWTTMRVYGVLMRIALCSLIAGMILVATRKPKLLAILAAVLLVGYWVLLRWVPVPGFGVPGHSFPVNDPVRNLTAWMDRGVVAWMQRWLHTGALYKKTSDPEGLLSTMTAVASVLLGALTGWWMRTAQPRRRMLTGLVLAGVVSFGAGELWSIWFPVNKNLWTSSFVLVSAGCALVLLAMFSALIDTRREPWPKVLRVATWPWLVFGSNAIIAFSMSILLAKILIYTKHPDASGKIRSLWWWAYRPFEAHGSTYWTSLAFAVCFVIVCFFPNWLLWRKKIFVRM